MGITHLRSIDVSATDPRELRRFYEDTWGLERVPGDDQADGRTGDTRIELRAQGREHHVLALVTGPGHTLEQIGLGAATTQDVDALAERLRTHRAKIEFGPAPTPQGYTVRFRDPEGRLVEVSADRTEHEAPSTRTDGPDRLSHIVLNCPDLPASRAFYVDVLGFEISDTYENDQMVFLRCNTQHHCVVLAPGEWASLNHVAFEVRDVDQVMRALGRMRRAGFDTIWGPGRHGPGGNVFCYFQDPAGNVIEYTAELIEVGDDWVAQAWPRTQENADVWGTSGGITPDVVRAMANPPASPPADSPATPSTGGPR